MGATPRNWRQAVGAAAALVVGLLALPTEAPAEISHDVLWGSSSSNCPAVDTLDSSRLETLVTRDGTAPALSASAGPDKHLDSSERTPCSSEGEKSEAANNLCFEDAGAPASVVPTLDARAGALDVTRGIVAAAHSVVSGNAVDVDAPEAVPRSLPVADVPTAPNRPDPQAACTPKHPEDCRSLPPLPPTLNVEAPAVPPRPTTGDVDVPGRPDAEDVPAPFGRRLGPSDGYDSPPDKPPRTTSRSG